MIELIGEKKLMYEIIFDDKMEYEIPLLEYIDLTEINNFCENIMSNLIRAGIEVKEDVLILRKEKKVWKLKIKR